MYKSHENDKILSVNTYENLPIDSECVDFGDAMKFVVSEVRK